MTKDEWTTIRATGRRWLYWRKGRSGETAVRVMSWSQSAARVKFPNGSIEAVHPGDLFGGAGQQRVAGRQRHQPSQR